MAEAAAAPPQTEAGEGGQKRRSSAAHFPANLSLVNENDCIWNPVEGLSPHIVGK